MAYKSPVGVGRMATVIVWGDGPAKQVLKLFRAGIGKDVAERELVKAQAARQAGAPTPQAYEPILEVDGQFGIVFDFVDGETLLKKIQKHPAKIKQYAQTLARVHIDLHHLQPKGLPRLKEKVATAIENTQLLSVQEKARLGNLLSGLLDGSALCHGDFHLDNILVSDQQSTKLTIIDWPDACIGDPVADVARTLILLDFGWSGAQGGKLFIKWAAKIVRHFYLSNYFALSGNRMNDLNRWMIIVAAARLNENIAAENEALLRYVRKGLAESAEPEKFTAPR